MQAIIDENGIERFLGNNPAPLRLSHTPYGDRYGDMIPRSQWGDLIHELDQAQGAWYDFPMLPPVHDQDGVGQCNADATTALMEFLRALEGLDFVALSAADLYAEICGGVDEGSNLEDGVARASRVGVGTVATCGTIWQGRNQRVASGSERVRYRVSEWELCPTFDHLFSASLRGFGGVSGIIWYDNYQIDGDGWLTQPGGKNGGHAIFKFPRPCMRQTNKGVEYGLSHQNSWRSNWGVQGRMVIPERCFKGPVGGWWIGRQMVSEDGGIPRPALARTFRKELTFGMRPVGVLGL